jgi:hypothetical protein
MSGIVSWFSSYTSSSTRQKQPPQLSEAERKRRQEELIAKTELDIYAIEQKLERCKKEIETAQRPPNQNLLKQLLTQRAQLQEKARQNTVRLNNLRGVNDKITEAHRNHSELAIMSAAAQTLKEAADGAAEYDMDDIRDRLEEGADQVTEQTGMLTEPLFSSQLQFVQSEDDVDAEVAALIAQAEADDRTAALNTPTAQVPVVSAQKPKLVEPELK